MKKRIYKEYLIKYVGSGLITKEAFGEVFKPSG
jgi:hypothetical protein